MASDPNLTVDSACVFRIEAQLMRHSDTLCAYLEYRIPKGLRRIISPEDILQEVWMVAANNLRGLQRSDEVRAWLLNATKQKLADAVKTAIRAKRGGKTRFEYNVRPAGSSGLDPFALADSGQRTPSSEDAAREAACAVRSAVRFLPDLYREAVMLRYLHEQSISAIAARMHITETTTRSRLYHGIRILRHRLGPAWRFFSDAGSVSSDPGSPNHDQ